MQRSCCSGQVCVGWCPHMSHRIADRRSIATIFARSAGALAGVALLSGCATPGDSSVTLFADPGPGRTRDRRGRRERACLQGGLCGGDRRAQGAGTCCAVEALRFTGKLGQQLRNQVKSTSAVAGLTRVPGWHRRTLSRTACVPAPLHWRVLRAWRPRCPGAWAPFRNSCSRRCFPRAHILPPL